MGNNNTKPDDDVKTKICDCVDAEGNLDISKLTEIQKIWEDKPCDIAIVGSSGSGKSSLINTLLGRPLITDAKELNKIRTEIRNCNHTNRSTCKHTYAPTSSREETTTAVPYSFDKSTRVCMWDLPGYGAKLWPSVQAYLEKFELHRYDAFLVIFRDDRRRTEDEDVIKCLISCSMLDRIVWVRTFFDNAMQGRPIEETNEQRGVFRDHIKTFLEPGSPDPEVHCVSSLYKPGKNDDHLYDLDRLKSTIIKIVPEHIQMEFSKKFKGFSSELIMEKFATLNRWAALRILVATGDMLGYSFVHSSSEECSAPWEIDKDLLESHFNLVVKVYGLFDLVSKTPLDQISIDEKMEKLAIETQFRAYNIHADLIRALTEDEREHFRKEPGGMLARILERSIMYKACFRINLHFRDIALAQVDIHHVNQKELS